MASAANPPLHSLPHPTRPTTPGHRDNTILQLPRDPPQPLVIFPQFNNLPKEVRLIIWEWAVVGVGPRIVYVKESFLWACRFGRERVRSDEGFPCHCVHCSSWYNVSANSMSVYNPARQITTGYRTLCPAPALLSVCKESYSVASKAYPLSFGSAGAFPTTRFNFEQDYLYLNISSFYDAAIGRAPSHLTMLPSGALLSGIREMQSADLSKVENLCIHLETSARRVNYESVLDDILGVCGNVKKLTIISKHSTHKYWEETLTEEEKWTLELIEPINISRAINWYRGKTWSHRHLRDHRVSLNEAFVTLNVAELESRRQLRISKIQEPYSMPIIDQKIVLSSAMKSRLLTLKREWEETTGCISNWTGHPLLYFTPSFSLPHFLNKEKWERYTDESW